jgi:hypothetical protein
VIEKEERIVLRMKVMIWGWPSGEEVTGGEKTIQCGWATVPWEASPSGSEFERRGMREPHQGSYVSTQSTMVVLSKEISL